MPLLAWPNEGTDPERQHQEVAGTSINSCSSIIGPWFTFLGKTTVRTVYLLVFLGPSWSGESIADGENHPEPANDTEMDEHEGDDELPETAETELEESDPVIEVEDWPS